MTTRTCDRCKKKIPVVEVVDAGDTSWRLRVIYDDPRLRLHIDLCTGCRKDLAEWLKGEKKNA